MEKTVFVRTKGWYMKELTNDLPLGRAEHYFTPYRQGRISSARRIDGAVRVTRHILICSQCGGCMPAYNRGGSKGRAFNKVELNEWLLGQCSFLGNDQEYDFNKPICVSDVQDLKCGSCGEYLGGPGRTEEYRINVSGAKLRISRRMSLAELISVGIAGRRELMAFAFTESVVFNKRKGHAYYEITDQSGQRLRTYDFSMGCYAIPSSPLMIGMKSYKKLQRTVFRFLTADSPHRDSLSEYKEDLDRLLLLLRFQGYKEPFYRSVPVSLEGGSVAPGFKSISKKLLSAENVPELYRKAGLPNCKSIKQQMFNSPELMFYCREIKMIWDILKDPNILSGLLKMEERYKMLTFLHDYPKAILFFQRLAEKNRSACTFALSHIRSCKEYIRSYMLMSDKMQERESVNWKGHKFFEMKNTYSVPDTKLYDRFEAVIDGYHFKQLKNTKQKVEAGRALHNCLENNEAATATSGVFAVIKNKSIKAAVQVMEDYILQAFLANNRELSNDEELLRAFESWKAASGLLEPSF